MANILLLSPGLLICCQEEKVREHTVLDTRNVLSSHSCHFEANSWSIHYSSWLFTLRLHLKFFFLSLSFFINEKCYVEKFLLAFPSCFIERPMCNLQSILKRMAQAVKIFTYFSVSYFIGSFNRQSKLWQACSLIWRKILWADFLALRGKLVKWHLPLRNAMIKPMSCALSSPGRSVW